MNRIVLIIVAIVVVAVMGIVVWQVDLPSDPTPPVATSAPAPQKFDTTGGQGMRPRWKANEGEGDGEANN